MPLHAFCQSDLCEIAINHILPAVGCIPLFYVIFSPIPAVRRMEIDKDVGTFNIAIFPAGVFVALCFLLYGLKVQNYYLFVPNGISFIASSYYCLSSIRYSTESAQRTLIRSICIGYGVIFIVAMLAFITFANDSATSTSILGILSCSALIVLNISPLINVKKIIVTKDSGSIFLPFAIAVLLTGVFWTAYGILLVDAFVTAGNVSSVLSSLIQIGLKLIYRPPRNKDFQKVVGTAPPSPGSTTA